MSEKITHTSNPWSVYDGDQHDTVFRKNRTVIATRGDSVRYAIAFCDYQYPEDAEANARLIAAAPELLAELKQCALETEEVANLILVDFPRTAKLLLKASKRTLALIAKAEGR